MNSLLLGFFTVLLILTCLFMILIILMQRPRSDSGLGAALGGGGAAESAFGAETGNILSRGTIYAAIFFFVVSFGLYLGHMRVNHSGVSEKRSLPELRPVEEPDDRVVVPPEDKAEPLDLTPVEPAPVPPEQETAPSEEAIPSEEGVSSEEAAPVEGENRP